MDLWGDCTFATTTGSSASDWSLNGMMDAVEKLRAIPVPLPIPTVYAHPFNAKLLGDRFEVRESDLLPETELKSTWEPTAWGPFANLEKSDEAWARPLGLGRVVTVEERVVYLIQEKQRELEMEMMTLWYPMSFPTVLPRPMLLNMF